MDHERVLDESLLPAYERLKSGLLRLIDEGKISREDAARVLPELRESEDEGTRKRAIMILKQQRAYWSYDGPIDKFPPATPRKDLVDAIDVALSYLEKQKEQKPQVFCEAKAYDLGYKQGKEDAIKEQKPAEWSKGDEVILDSVIRIITQFDEPTCAGPKWTHPYTKELNFLNGLRNRLFNKND